MIEELANEYSEYIKVNLERELQNVQDTIDDMLTRLDEFENLVNMVKVDNELCSDISVPVILQSKDKLDSLFKQVDSLEMFVNRVKSDVDLVEAQVQEAEEGIGQTSRNPLFKKMLKPLFTKMSPSSTPVQRPAQTTMYVAPILFSTSNFFPSQAEEDAVQKEQKS